MAIQEAIEIVKRSRKNKTGIRLSLAALMTVCRHIDLPYSEKKIDELLKESSISDGLLFVKRSDIIKAFKGELLSPERSM